MPTTNYHKPFYLVGPTSAGKSELAAAVAERCRAEIVGADAFQIYAALPLLTAKPARGILETVPHHLIGSVLTTEEMSAARYRDLALNAFSNIEARGKKILVVGGSGMWLYTLIHGLSDVPASIPELRTALEELSREELVERLRMLDPASLRITDLANKRRVLRAVEICVLSGQRASELRQRKASEISAPGVFVFRHRDDLYRSIDARVESMFSDGVVEEVRAIGEMSRTAEQALGLREIRQLLAGEINEQQCIGAIKQATRRYAKRQLTWFRRQSNYEPLNLSDRTAVEAVEWITHRARLSFAHD